MNAAIESIAEPKYRLAIFYRHSAPGSNEEEQIVAIEAIGEPKDY